MPPNGDDGGLPPGRSAPGEDDGPGREWTAIDAPAAPAPPPATAAHHAGSGGPVPPPPPPGPLLMGPMNFADVLDGAFTLYRANARTLVTVAAVVLLPVQLLVAWLSRNLFAGGATGLINDPSTSRFTFAGQGSGIAGTVVALASSALVIPFLYGVVCRVASASYFGGQLGPGAAFRAVRGRWWALVVAWIVVHLAEGAGGMLLFFPALLVMALFMAVAPAIAIEGLGPIQGMRRSAHLLGPRMFPVLGIALGSAVVVAGVGFALGWLPSLLGVVTGPWGWLFRAAGAVTTGVLTTPYVALVATLVYFDARVRSEGMDVALLAGRLAHRAADG
jgi:hypothetical protein